MPDTEGTRTPRQRSGSVGGRSSSEGARSPAVSQGPALKDEDSGRPPSKDDKAAEASPRGLGTFLKDVVLPFLAVSAAAGYALLRPAYDGFYGSLGLRPEDVGFDQVQMLSLGALAGALYGIELVIAALLGYVVYLLLSSLKTQVRFVVSLPLLLLAWAISVRGTAAGTYIGPYLLNLFRNELSVALFSAVIISLTREWLVTVFEPIRKRLPTKVLRRIAVATIAGLVLTLLLTASLWSRFTGQDAGAQMLSDPKTFFEERRNLSPLLYNILHPIEVLPLTEDRLGICAKGHDGAIPEIYLLGRSPAGAFVIVFNEYKFGAAGKVVWLPSADYGVFSVADVPDPFAGGPCRTLDKPKQPASKPKGP